MNWKDERDKLLLAVPRTPAKFFESLKNLSDLLFRVKLKVRVDDLDEKIGGNAPYLEAVCFDRLETLDRFILIRRYFWGFFGVHFLLLGAILFGGMEPVPLWLIRSREIFQELSICLYLFLSFYLWLYDRRYTSYQQSDKPGIALSVDGRLLHIFHFNFEKYLKKLLRSVPEEDVEGLSYVYVSYGSEHEDGPVKDALAFYFPGSSPYVIVFAKTIWDRCPEHVDIMPFFFDISFARSLYEQIGYHKLKITPPDPVRAKEAEVYGTMMFRRYFYGGIWGCFIRYFRVIFKIGLA